MKVLALLLLAGAAFVAAKPYPYYPIEQAESIFEGFIKTYHKHYPTEQEKLLRFEIFKQNLIIINLKNNANDGTVFAINTFSDLTTDEFVKVHTGLQGNLLREGSECDAGSVKSSDAPESFDWREKGVISKPKNQLKCGSCWAFASIGSVEAQHAIKNNRSTSLELSQQQLVDCDKRSNGCGGTTNMEFPFLYLRDSSGSMLEQDYPYEGADGECRADAGKAKVKVTGCRTFKPETEEELKNILYREGPITIGVDAMDLQAYSGKILNKCEFTEVNHAVLLVGYGVENGVPYWVIKNSWGEDYGEKGFVRVRRGVNACGLMSMYMVKAVIA